MARDINCGKECSEDFKDIDIALFPGVKWEQHSNGKFGCNWPDTKYNEDGRLICANRL